MDNLTKSQRHKNMQHIRSSGTKIEQLVINALRHKKLYFTINVTSLSGKPDIVFSRKRIAIFLDSDFWHGNPKRYIQPKTNRKYWITKIQNNIARDKTINRELKKQGWVVLRFWEYDIKHHTNKILNTIVSTLEKKR